MSGLVSYRGRTASRGFLRCTERRRRARRGFLFSILVLLAAYADAAETTADATAQAADVLPPAIATVDLATSEGLRAVSGTWRYSPAKIVETRFASPGPDGQPGGPEQATYEISPRAGAAGFDDSSWTPVSPESLSARRGRGRLDFNWYRLALTVPPSVGGKALAGTTAVFETSVDDYAEIWVDGEIARAAEQSGGSVIAGWNATNRLVAARGVKPGQRIEIAVFAANGPLSNPPTNFVYLRSAKLSFHPSGGPVAIAPAETNVEVLRRDPALARIVGPNPKLFKIADGFEFTEGPVWVDDGAYLLFSDPNANRIYRWSEAEGLSVFRRNSGYEGADVGGYRQPGSNGLTLDPEGRLVVNEHGRRRVSRTERDGSISVLAASYRGKRLNSPNDLVYRSDGSLYFTDPPFGLPKVFDDRRKELPFSGVYRLAGGKLDLLVDDLTGPNGIAFSPDERFLYVGDWDEKKKVVLRYPVLAGGGLGRGEVFADLTSAPGEDAIDGVKVDVEGNVYVSGPGGLWIFSPGGTHLGTVVAPKHPHNMAWGGQDGRTLYLCARSGLYRMRFGIEGVRPGRAATEIRDRLPNSGDAAGAKAPSGEDR